MTMQDPMADMLTRIRNAQAVQQPNVCDAEFEAEGGDRAAC